MRCIILPSVACLAYIAYYFINGEWGGVGVGVGWGLLNTKCVLIFSTNFETFLTARGTK